MSAPVDALIHATMTFAEVEELLRGWRATLSARIDVEGLVRAEVRRLGRTYHGVSRKLAGAVVAALEAAARDVDLVAA